MIVSQESTTAKLCSFARAYHSTYVRKKIFDDDLAFDFMGPEQYRETGQLIGHDYRADRFDPDRSFRSSEVAEKLDHYLTPIPLSRIAFAEQALAAFARRFPLCQYVICGAGMDTFLFRNADEHIRIFEIDHPDTQRFKRERIRQLEWSIPQNVRLVPVDFERDDMGEALLAAGLDPQLPTFFSVLGVTYYLPLAVFEDTVRRMAAFPNPENELVFDFPDEKLATGSARGAELMRITAMLGEPMAPGYRVADVTAMLLRSGFRCKEHLGPEEIEARYFRGRTDGLRAFEDIHFILAGHETTDRQAQPLPTGKEQ